MSVTPILDDIMERAARNAPPWMRHTQEFRAKLQRLIRQEIEAWPDDDERIGTVRAELEFWPGAGDIPAAFTDAFGDDR